MTNPRMTEDQIERYAERAMDKLDKRLMSGDLDQADYDFLVRVLNAETEYCYKTGQRPSMYPDSAKVIA